MKRFILTLIFVLAAIVSFCQAIDYPRYDIDSLGQKVVVLTIAQATELDNNSELLGLFEKLNVQLGEYDSVCIKVINEKEKVIALQKIEIACLKEALLNKDQQISALQHEIAGYQAVIAALEGKIRAKDKIIEERERQLRRLKLKAAIGGIGESLMIFGLLVAIVVLN